MARFEACLVAEKEWTHEAHLVAGYWYVRQLGAERALDEVRTRIMRFNESVGTPNSDTRGYHETITRLYLDAIAAHIRDLPLQATFEEGLARLLSSPMASSAWPLSRYSRERLFSVQARRAWVEPDLA